MQHRLDKAIAKHTLTWPRQQRGQDGLVKGNRNGGLRQSLLPGLGYCQDMD